MTQIREALRQDCENILSLAIEFEKHFNCGRIAKDVRDNLPLIIKRQISLQDGFFFVADDGERLVGYAFGQAEKKYARSKKFDHIWLAEVYVSPAVRGRRIGKQLLEKVLQWAKRLGIKKLCLKVETDDKRSHAFWKKRGFHESWIGMEKAIKA